MGFWVQFECGFLGLDFDKRERERERERARLHKEDGFCEIYIHISVRFSF